MGNIRFLVLFLALSLNCKLWAQHYPKPVKVIARDGISVPVYDFKSFEPMLKMTNDTTYVVNFWATWCQPCVTELPNFEQLNTNYIGKKVKVILVSLDMNKQAESKLLPFIKRKNLRSKVVFLNDPDANSWIEKVNMSWSGAIPATVIYNAHKRGFYERSFTFEELEKEIKLFIN